MTDDRGESDLTLQIEKLQARIKQLEETLSSAQDSNNAHQKYNGNLQTRLTEVEEDNKKLSGQINDYIKKEEHMIRKAGLQ
jgi:predicted  nucleic acid-binding Zn-ribbon protein